MSRRHLASSAALALSLALVACTSAPARPQAAPPAGAPAMPVTVDMDLPAHVQQGSMVIGRTRPDAVVQVGARTVRVAPDGRFVFGVGRDATGEVVVRAHLPIGEASERHIAIDPRDWPLERIDGVPENTVNPPPDIAARIEREQASVAAERTRDDAREDFAQPFVWPIEGRISGRFGNQRIYNGTPKAPHSGMDIAAEQGAPVKAPAAGIVTFAAPDLYLTGGTVLIDHGAGISSNFLHLSRIDVKVGDRVEQGQVFGAVGATGRATGPHLHWGMNWFDTRIDPLLVLELNSGQTH